MIQEKNHGKVVYVGLIGLSLLLLAHTVCAVDLILDGTTATLSGDKTYGTVNLTNGAILYIEDHSAVGGGKLRIQAWKVYVDSTSQIIGAERGYRGGQSFPLCSDNPGEDGEDTNGGPAKNRPDRLGAGEGGHTSINKAEGAGGGGAGYGGTGGSGGNEENDEGIPGSGGSPYGSTDSYSAEMGSGGGGGSASCDKDAAGGAGGDGGAALEIVATHSIIIEGDIDCSGQIGAEGSRSGASGGGGGGGGAGGGVFIAAPRLNFTGTIDVIGGDGGDGEIKAGGGGGGAGGRIKLAGCDISISGNYVLSGGLPGQSTGTDGTAGGDGTYMEVIDCYTFSLLPAEIKAIEITNLGVNTTDITLSVVGSQIQNWVTLDPNFLSIPSLGSDIVTVGIYPPFFMPKGYYYGQILINSSGTDFLYVDLSIWIKRRELVSLTPNSWDTALASGWEESRVFSICNTGDTTLYDVNIITSGAANWILFPEGKNLGDLPQAVCVYREGILQVPEGTATDAYNGTISVISGVSANATVLVNVTAKDCGEWCQHSRFYSGLCRENQSQCCTYNESFQPYGSEKHCSIYKPENNTCCCYISCMDACINADYNSWNCENGCSLGWYNVYTGNTYCMEDEGYTDCCCM